MSNADLTERESELSKKDRLVNAWAAADDDTSAGVVADVTDSSLSYAARVKSSIEDGEIDEETLDDVRDDDLVEAYAARIQRREEGVPTGEADRTNPTSSTDTGDGNAPPDEPERWQPRQADRRTQQPSPDAQTTAGRQSSQDGQRGASRPPRQPSHQGQSPPRRQQSQQALERQYQPPRPPQSPSGDQRPPGSAGGPQASAQPRRPQQGQADVRQQIRELDDLLATYEAEARYHLENMPAQDAAPAVSKLFVVQQIRPRLRAILDGTGTTSQ